MERKIDEWEKSRNVSLEQNDRTEPPPPPQAQTKQVNAVFTGSGKSDDPPKILKDPPPPIIVNNKTKKDKPIKTSKRAITWILLISSGWFKKYRVYDCYRNSLVDVKGHISIENVSSIDNIADILAKPLKCESFNYLRLGLGMMEHIP
ncbi:hypothetical protein Tco_0864577 [Tanacetum coccineum]